jgi:hypothetical protein
MKSGQPAAMEDMGRPPNDFVSTVYNAPSGAHDAASGGET